MKKPTRNCYAQLLKLTVFICLIFNSNIITAQLHEENGCVNSYSLNWDSSPSADDQFNWLPKGSTSNTFDNVDNSGIDISINFTGQTNSFEDWNFSGGANTPNVDDIATNGGEDVLHLFTEGYSNQGITMTITFSEPIFGLGFDLYHVNAGGSNGDKYTVTAINNLGETIYPTFSESANPSYTTNAVGVVNANNSSTAGDNAQVGINFYDNNYITSVSFLWQDCNTCRTGFVHGSGLGKISFCTPQELDFDGQNDYLSHAPFLGGKREATMMSWVKIDAGFSGDGEIMGQRNFRLHLDNNKLNAYVKTNNNNGTSDYYANNHAIAALETELWYHVATVYNGTTDELYLYLNGEEIAKYTNLNGSRLKNNNTWNANHDFEIGRNTFSDNNYFKGSIVEARVFDVALDTEEIQQQIYQEIENNNGVVMGSVIKNEINNLSWSNLLLYYKLIDTDSRQGITPNTSAQLSDGVLHNMRTRQDINAPLPYIANQNGNWTSQSIWQHGNVWDIDNSKHKDWAIVKITNNTLVDTNDSHTLLGLIIENDAKLEVNNNQFIANSKYLKIDGVLDLKGESQLVQTIESTLDVTSSGYIEIDQQGTSDSYTYNYWSLPVSEINSIQNNKAASLNNVLFDATNPENVLNINFQASHTAADSGASNPIILSNYWIYKFHGPEEDYYSWSHVGSNTALAIGEGYTMKGTGTGNVTDRQNYSFIGKPNNGDISLTIHAGEQYLLGNPYPSALDADTFIKDNLSFINGGNNLTSSMDGTLYFWDHFGGGSHITTEYQGGYAVYNLSGSVRALSHPEVSNIGVGNKKPERFIPVAQGFFVKAVGDASINFNNSQRVFKTKSAEQSVFLRTNNSSESTDDRMKLRLEYTTLNGVSRELLLTVDANTSFGYNLGYDGENLDANNTDLNWSVANRNCIIQGIPFIENNTILPLNLKQNQREDINISLLSAQNIPEHIRILFEDVASGEIINLRENNYQNILESGEYNGRFRIKFEDTFALSTADNMLSNTDFLIINNKESLKIINRNQTNPSESYTLFSILGQEVSTGSLHAERSLIQTNGLAKGVYIIKITNENNVISRKVLLE